MGWMCHPGAAGGEAKPHSPPWTIPCALAHLFHQHCSAEPIPPVPAGPLGAQGSTGGFWGAALGFCPPLSSQLCTLGGCISCVSKPPSCPRNSHNLLCVFLAQKRLIHSLKQINYFCYLEKKRKKKINPLELVGLTFNWVHNAVKQICSEPEQRSSHGVRSCKNAIFTCHVSSGLCNLESICECVFFLTYITNGANVSLPWRWTGGGGGKQMFLFPDTFYNLFPFWFLSCRCGSRLPE